MDKKYPDPLTAEERWEMIGPVTVTLPEGLTVDALLEAVFSYDDSIGFCLMCGQAAYNVEPDAKRLACEGCGCAAVYGAQEILVMLG